MMGHLLSFVVGFVVGAAIAVRFQHRRLMREMDRWMRKIS